MNISPIFTINNAAAGTFAITTSGATITLALASTYGVKRVTWTVRGQSTNNYTTPVATAVSGVYPYNSQATLVLPTIIDSYGYGAIIECQVNDGRTIDGVVDPSLTTTQAVFILDATGSKPMILGETFERDPVMGIIEDLNQRLVNGGGGGGGGVVSVFARSGNVVASAGDYSASQIVNDSGVVGSNVDDALDNLQTAINALTTGGGGVAISAGTQLASTGTVRFSNSNNVTFGMNAGTLTASFSAPAQTNYVFSNSNGLSFGTNGSTVTGSYTVPTVPTQTSVSFSNANNVSFGFAGSTLTASASFPAATSLSFANSNGITFGVNASTVTASYTVPSVPAQTAFVLSNSNGISFGTNGSTVTASYTTPTQTSVSYSNLNGVSFGLNGSTLTASVSAQTAALFSASNGITFGTNAGTVTASYTVPSTAGLLSAIKVSAGTLSNNLSALTFADSNGLSFGLNGSVITGSYTVPSVPAQTVQTQSNVQGISAGTTVARTGDIVFSNSNGISFGMNGNTITATVQPGAAAGVAAIQAGTQTQTSGTLVFANSNGLTFGMSGSSQITGSYTVPTQTAYQFSNSNGLTFGTNGSTVTASYTVPTQTAFVLSNSNGISFGTNGSTVTASYTVPTATSVSYSNLNGVSFGLAGSTLTASVAAQTSLSFANGNGVSFGLNGSTLTASVAPSAGSVNISAGTTSNNVTNFVFSNSNGLAFGLNGSTITGSYTTPTQSAQTVGLYALGNTTQNSSTTLDARSLSFNGLGAATVGYSNGSVQVSVPVQTAFVFSNSNNVTFGANGSTVTASASFAQSAQTQSNIAGIYDGANSISTGTIRYSNANGVSFGINGQTLTASVAAQTAFVLSNSNGISFGTNAGTVTASYTVPTQTSVSYSNLNGVTFGLNASTLTASVAAQTNQTIGLYAASNTTQNSSTTLDARSLTFQGAGIASVGYSNGSVIVSVPSAGANINFSAGTTSGNVGAVTFSNANGVSFGLNAGVITASAAGGGGGSVNISAGTTSGNLTNFVFSNSNSVSFGLNGSTITASVPGASSIVGVGGISLSTNGSTLSISASNFGTANEFEINPFLGTASSNFTANSVSSGVASFFPFVLPMYVNAGHIQVIQSMAFLTNGTSSGQQTFRQSWALYTRGTGTNSTTLGTIYSNSFSMGVTGNNSTYTINQPTSSNATGYVTGSTTSAGVNITSGYTGMKLVGLNINSTMSPGNYWLGVFNAGSTSSINVGISVSYMGVGINTQKNILAPIGSFSSQFSNGGVSGGNNIGAWMPGFGSYSSAGQTNLPVSVAMSAISMSASNVVTVFPYMKMVGTV